MARKTKPLMIDGDVKALNGEELQDVLDGEPEYRRTVNYRMAKEIEHLRERLHNIDPFLSDQLDLTDYVDYIRQQVTT